MESIVAAHADNRTLDPAPGTSARKPSVILLLAGCYNLLWGAAVVSFPAAPFAWAGMVPPRYPELWQCIGMIVGVYGVGYLIAATDPLRHWPIVLVGLLGKIFGPVGFLAAVLRGRLPWIAGATILTNDVVWWIPFGALLFRAHVHHRRSPQRRARLTSHQ